MGDNDPVSAYGRLRQQVAGALHNELDLVAVRSLFSKMLAWFLRMFTPPDQIVDSIRRLAAEPWRDPDQIATLKQLATNDHHLQLFLSEVVDPGWLEPLRAAGVLKPPPQRGLWPSSLKFIKQTSPKANTTRQLEALPVRRHEPTQGAHPQHAASR